MVWCACLAREARAIEARENDDCDEMCLLVCFLRIRRLPFYVFGVVLVLYLVCTGNVM